MKHYLTIHAASDEQAIERLLSDCVPEIPEVEDFRIPAFIWGYLTGMGVTLLAWVFVILEKRGVI